MFPGCYFQINGLHEVRSGAEPLELGSQVKAVVLDKTGTLTMGRPSAVARCQEMKRNR